MARHVNPSRTLRRFRWLIRAGFALALLGTLVFTVRLGADLLYWSDPARQDQPLAGWMPLGYVARSWDVPREVLVEAARLPEDQRPRRTLEAIALQRGIPLPALIAEIEAAITQSRERADE